MSSPLFSITGGRTITQVRCILLLLLAGTPFFFIGGPRYHSPRSFVALWDLGHILFFALTAWLLCIIIHYRRAVIPPLTVKLYVFLLILFVGITIELIQFSINGRSPSSGDVLRNQLGCLITFAFIQSNKKTVRSYLFLISVFLLACIAAVPLARAAFDELTALRQFPILSNFETPFEVDRWKPVMLHNMQKSLTEDRDTGLKLQLTTKKYSGASLFYFPGNWKEYNTLVIRIYFPETDQIQLICRIHDTDHNDNYNDRFNTTFTLHKGWNNLVIPMYDIQHGPENRLLNIQQVEEVTLFVMQEEKNHVIFISSVFLDR